MGASGFPTTSWGMVLAARGAPSSESQEALARLCDSYWRPVYYFIRRRGFRAEEARDLTQEFFARLLDRHYLKTVDRERGRFRSFLLAAVRHFLSNEMDRIRAQKRGAGRAPLSLDFETAEGRYADELATGETPETVFERRWATALLERVLRRLAEDCQARGKGEQFAVLKGFLTADGTQESCSEAAQALGVTEVGIRVAVHRLRARYGKLLRDEVGQTVASPEEIDEEIRCLVTVLGS